MNDNIGRYCIYDGRIYEISSTPELPVAVGEMISGSLYEVLRAVDGKLLFYKDHMTRLNNSIRLSGLKFEINEYSLKEDLIKLINVSGYANCNIKIVIFKENDGCHLYAYLSKFYYPDEKIFDEGVKVDFIKIERTNPNAKMINTEYKQKVTEAIINNGLFEVLLVNRDGYVTEGSRTNVFIIKGKEVYTAPVDMVLEGITRKYVLEACWNTGINVIEKVMTTEEILKSDGIFLSGTSIKTLPVSSVGKIQINTGSNSIFKEILQAFNLIFRKGLE